MMWMPLLRSTNCSPQQLASDSSHDATVPSRSLCCLQTKENLTSNRSSFGSKCELSTQFLDKVAKCGIVDNILSFANFRNNKELKKSDGAKRQRLVGECGTSDQGCSCGLHSMHDDALPQPSPLTGVIRWPSYQLLLVSHHWQSTAARLLHPMGSCTVHQARCQDVLMLLLCYRANATCNSCLCCEHLVMFEH
jgi:hypothetical protein